VEVSASSSSSGASRRVVTMAAKGERSETNAPAKRLPVMHARLAGR
jgi:hypothetical protein